MPLAETLPVVHARLKSNTSSWDITFEDQPVVHPRYASAETLHGMTDQPIVHDTWDAMPLAETLHGMTDQPVVHDACKAMPQAALLRHYNIGNHRATWYYTQGYWKLILTWGHIISSKLYSNICIQSDPGQPCVGSALLPPCFQHIICTVQLLLQIDRLRSSSIERWQCIPW